jgi:hypothetical protein
MKRGRAVAHLRLRGKGVGFGWSQRTENIAKYVVNF